MYFSLTILWCLASENFYKSNINYAALYSQYWQDSNSYFHGATATGTSPRAATKHGPVVASTAHNSLPSFIIGLNESGNGTSKVFIRSSEITPATSSGVTDAFDIANGKSLGTIAVSYTHLTLPTNREV